MSSACHWRPCWTRSKSCRLTPNEKSPQISQIFADSTMALPQNNLRESEQSVECSSVSLADTALAGTPSEIRIGNRALATRYFLAPLAGYTHLAFRRVVRE